MRTRTVCMVLFTFIVVLSLGASAEAPATAEGADQKVQMPKEGPFEFEFCYAGPLTMVVAAKEFTGGNYANSANIRTTPPGGAFDRQSARCWGTFTNVGGKAEHKGICEIVDQDGDKWYIDVHGNSEGTGGAYSARYGTGKYAGMVLNGQWRENSLPMTADIVHGCNPNKGTYKLAP